MIKSRSGPESVNVNLKNINTLQLVNEAFLEGLWHHDYSTTRFNSIQ